MPISPVRFTLDNNQKAVEKVCKRYYSQVHEKDGCDLEFITCVCCVKAERHYWCIEGMYVVGRFHYAIRTREQKRLD